MTTTDGVPAEPTRAGEPGLRWHGDGALGRDVARGRSVEEPAAIAPSARSRRGDPTVLQGVALASVPRRAAGWFIDAFFKFLILEVVLVLGGAGNVVDPFEPSLLIAGQLLTRGYDWIFFTRGWTPGSRLLGMRIVRVEGGGEPGPRRALVRVAGSMVSEAAFGVGFAWALWDRHRQTWQDKLARTYVVMVKPADRR